MMLIGIIANRKNFEKIKTHILERTEEAINMIHIHAKSIPNIKNIKFDVLIIENKLEKFQNYQETLEKIRESANYVLINTDLNPTFEKKENSITYGLNQEAMVTVSSIKESDILIYWQEAIKNRNKKMIEIEERRIKIKEKNTLKVEEILIISIVFRIYYNSIIEEI